MLVSARGISEMIPRVTATNPGIDTPIGRIAVAPTTPMEIGVMEMTPVVASPVFPLLQKRGRCR